MTRGAARQRPSGVISTDHDRKAALPIVTGLLVRLARWRWLGLDSSTTPREETSTLLWGVPGAQDGHGEEEDSLCIPAFDPIQLTSKLLPAQMTPSPAQPGKMTRQACKLM